MNDGDHETSGTSFKRLRTCLKQRNQLLTLRLQNLHITEYKGKKFSGFLHDAKVSMQLFTKPQKISIGNLSLSVSL